MKIADIVNSVFAFKYEDGLRYFCLPNEGKFILSKNDFYLNNKKEWKATGNFSIEDYMKSKSLLKTAFRFDSIEAIAEFVAKEKVSLYNILAMADTFFFKKGDKDYCAKYSSNSSGMISVKEYDLKNYREVKDARSKSFNSLEDFLDKSSTEIEEIFNKEEPTFKIELGADGKEIKVGGIKVKIPKGVKVISKT